ncbi:MAG: carbon-nitrogen hydrolase family protein [Candidatus Bathyarchaeia archaeon]
MKVAAIQIGPEHASKEMLETLVATSVDGGARLLCFPEHWIGNETERGVSTVIELMKNLARDFRVTIIAGGFYLDFQEGPYVAAPVIDLQGKVIGVQRKIHLFGEEKKIAKPGSDITIFNIDGVRLGVIICYDLAFPEVARALALKGVDLVFVPSRILSHGVKPWHLYLSTRCLENRLPMVSANIVWPPQYIGQSIILGLEEHIDSSIVYPKIIGIGGQSSEAIVAEIDLETARRLRESRLSERRPEVYKSMLNG